MDSIRTEILKCTKCPDLIKSRRQAVPGDGAIPARTVFVGLAPGRNGADVTGVPFTRDPSGLLFRNMLEESGFKDYFITNIVKCNPKDSEGRNRPPALGEIQSCTSFLKMEINITRPHFVVPLGKQATEFFIGKIGAMTTTVLKKIRQDGLIIIPMLHPSFVIRGAYKREKYLNDFFILGRMIYDAN